MANETNTDDGILKLRTNVPETIAVRFTDGLPVTSKYSGDQLMFSLVDGRRTFLPPFVAQKIAASGIRPEENFIICKREVKQGNRRVIEYQIDLVHEAAAAAVPVQETSRIHVAGARARALTPTESEGLGLRAPAAVAAPTAPAKADLSSVESMKLAGRGAVDCALDIEGYARSKGMTDFLFGAENIQKIAVTLYIDLRKGGRA